MPIVNVQMLEGRPQAVKQRIANDITEVIVRHLGADPGHVYVMFSDVARGDWAVAGRFFDEPPAPADEPR